MTDFRSLNVALEYLRKQAQTRPRVALQLWRKEDCGARLYYASPLSDAEKTILLLHPMADLIAIRSGNTLITLFAEELNK